MVSWNLFGMQAKEPTLFASHLGEFRFVQLPGIKMGPVENGIL
jgi:hypothetical protein